MSEQLSTPDRLPDQRGLYGKFHVVRTDGKSAPGQKHDGCRYYVLDVDHDPHATPALHAYADSARREHPALARDLDTLAGRPDAPTPTSAGQARREYHTDGRPLGCPHFDQPAPVGDSLAVSATEGQVWAALEEVWDDGNAVGLDGWTGPGRGAGDVDDYAVFARERVIRKVLARLGIEVTP